MNETEAFIKYEKKATFVNIFSTVLAAVMLAVVIVFAVLGLTLGSGDEFSPYYFVMLFGAVGYCVALPIKICNHRRIATVALYRAYSRVLSRNPRNSVAEISQVLGRSESEVVSDFVRLDRLGFFADLKIDSEHNTVSMASDEADGHDFVCPVCGGTTVQSSENADVCAFCGTVREKEKEEEE